MSTRIARFLVSNGRNLLFEEVSQEASVGSCSNHCLIFIFILLMLDGVQSMSFSFENICGLVILNL